LEGGPIHLAVADVIHPVAGGLTTQWEGPPEP